MSSFKVGHYYDNALIGMDSEEVKTNLEAIAYGVAEQGYTQHLSTMELAEYKDQYSRLHIELGELAIRKKEVLDKLKEIEKEPKIKAKFLLECIKTGTEQKFGKLYLVDDQQAGLMFSFDEKGICVDARPLAQNEKQTRLRNV